jgi:hypothetical protein
MSRKAHQPDPAQRRQVETLAAYGIPADDISRVVAIDPKTLRKHYRDELDLGTAKANAQVAGFLFNSARNGNVTAQIFWLKTRAKWKEAPAELRHSGAVATAALNELTDEALERIILSLGPNDVMPAGRHVGALMLEGAPNSSTPATAPTRRESTGARY